LYAQAWRLYKKGRSLELLDPALKSTAVPEQVELCVRIGLLCVQADPRLRPDMKRVVIILSKKQSTLEEPTRPGVPGSRYRRRAHGPHGWHYSVGSSSGTSSPSTSNAMTTSSTNTMRSQGLPSHREENGPRYRRRAHGPRGSHYSIGSSSGTSSPSMSNAMTMSSTNTMRSQGLPSHREEQESARAQL
jgi:hypothetical protein